MVPGPSDPVLTRDRRSPRPFAIVVGAVLLAALGALLFSRDAAAHNRSISHSTWELDDAGASVQVRFSAIDLSLLQLRAPDGDAADPVARYAAEHLVLERDGKPCPLTDQPHVLPAPDGWRVFEWRVACPSGGRAVRSSLLLAEAPSHLHFARVRDADGKSTERVLAEGDGTWPVDPDGDTQGGRGTSFLGYVLLGVEHIASGWDHLAFLVALLLLARTVREVATLVTAFTLAHSVTLALAALGLVRPDAAGVESLIGFSIALVAAENAWLLAGRERAIPTLTIVLLLLMAGLAAGGVGTLRPLALLGLGLFSFCHFALLDRAARPARLRAAIAFAFGLVHGFGFAGVLASMALPSERLVHALVGFNVGVELGQLALLALLWPLLRFLERWQEGRFARLVPEIGSAAICGLGLFWFLTRALR